MRVGTSRHGLRLCGYCGLAVLVEVGLFASYRGHDAGFHWLTHFFVGSGVALAGMTVWARVTRRPAGLPLLWMVAGHVVAMFPDFLFTAGVAHRRWMDVFLGHVTSHSVPGRNLTWYVLWAVALAAYLAALDRLRPRASPAGPGAAPE